MRRSIGASEKETACLHTPLSELVTHIGAGISRAFFDEPNGIPVLRSNNAKNGEIVLDEIKYWHRVDPGGADLERVKPKLGDVLINFVNGSARELGKAAIFRGAPTECIISTNFFIVRVDKKKLTPEYLNFFLQSKEYARWLFRTCGFSGQGSFNQKQLLSLKVPLRDIAQQRQITGAIGLTDRARRSLDELIEAKREFKRGLAQQLLTGKKRFPRFRSSKWVIKSIGDLFEEVERRVVWDDEAEYRLVSIRRRSGGMFLREVKRGSDIKTKQMFVVNAGDVVISRMQVVHGALAIVPPELDGCHVSGTYFVLTPKKGAAIDPAFFDCLSHLPRMYHAALVSSYGVHIEKMTFNPEWYLQTKIRVPSVIDEQGRIVEALRLADAELALLEAQRENYSLYKRGLLARLLSGELPIAP